MKAYRGSSLAFGLVCCIAFCVFAQEKQEGEQKLARKIRETVEKIHAVRMKRLRLQKEYQKQIGKIERQIERLKSELENTKTAACEKKKMADSLETRIEHDKKMQQIAKSLFYQSGEVAKLAVEKMKKRIAIGIPYQKRKRQQQINQIIHGLQSSTPRDQAIGLNDCCRFFTEELQLGKTIALWNGPVLIESGRRQKHAYHVRLGLVNQFFVSEDGQIIRLAAKVAGQEWKATDVIQERQFRAILDILQQRRPPELISVPCTIPRSPHKDASGDTFSQRKSE